MIRSRRDDFSEAVKRTIAARVNSRCSNPACGAPTSGPQSQPDKSLNIGVAAHITAASHGGPRYSEALTAEQRTSATNGIWLCQNCAKLIDNDVERYPETILRRWKCLSEGYALDNIGQKSPFDKTSAPLLAVFRDEIGPYTEAAEYLREENLRNLLLSSLSSVLQPYDDAEVIASGRGAMGQAYAALALSRNYGWDWEIVFFVGGEFGWEPIARTNLDGQKGHTPSARYVPGTPGALALTHVDGYGTGIFRQSTSWHVIAKGHSVAILSYPDNFYVVGWGMPFERHMTSTITKMPPRLKRGMILELTFKIEYRIGQQFASDGADCHLFTTQITLSLEWHEEAGIFVPHSAQDDLSIIDLLWNESGEGFIQCNRGTLERLIKEGTTTQSEFVKTHLLSSNVL